MLPSRGLRASGAGLPLMLALNRQPRGVAKALDVAMVTAGFGGAPGGIAVAGPSVIVIDSIGENGAALIEVDRADEAILRCCAPGVRLVPEVFYEPLSLSLSLSSALQPVGGGVQLKVTVTAKGSGRPLPDIPLVGFTDFSRRLGAQAVTDARGVAVLRLPRGTESLERLYAFADDGFWSALLTAVPAGKPVRMALDRIDLAANDGLRLLYGLATPESGAGVRVGVIDTGVGPHRDLVVSGGFNAVRGQNPGDFGDNGDRHGTHVGGIIAARGTPPDGVRGLAPGAQLFSYRVFPRGGNASNFDIAKAIDRAARDRCDLINLSLGRPAGPGSGDEPLVRVALEDARHSGVLPIAAAGNDFRRPVGFPASDDLCVAVTALGRRSTLPRGTTSARAAAPPSGSDPDEFIADFSNIGPEVDVTAPGVGIVSTVPGDRYAVMDGTSMACPAATASAARLLAGQSAILRMNRDLQRTAAILSLLLASARGRGFPAAFEGRGLPVP